MKASLLLLVFSLFATAAQAEPGLRCGRFGEAELAPPEPRAANWPLHRLEQINEAVKTEPYRVLFLGDSLVEHFAIGAGAAVWHQHLAPRGVLDAGIAGDRTEHLLWRLDHGNLDGPPPRAAILLIGTNDLGYHRTPEVTADGIRAVLLRLRERQPGAPILLLGLWPRGEDADSPYRAEISEVNRRVATCADNRSVIYGDIGKVLLDADGRFAAAMSPDHLHPTTAGYAQLAPSLDALIDKLTGR